MGNILDELSNVTAVACDECGGAGFIFFGNENDYDVMPCDCIADVEDELTLDWVNE
jgi:hypothetical protein